MNKVSKMLLGAAGVCLAVGAMAPVAAGDSVLDGKDLKKDRAIFESALGYLVSTGVCKSPYVWENLVTPVRAAQEDPAKGDIIREFDKGLTGHVEAQGRTKEHADEIYHVKYWFGYDTDEKSDAYNPAAEKLFRLVGQYVLSGEKDWRDRNVQHLNSKLYKERDDLWKRLGDNATLALCDTEDTEAGATYDKRYKFCCQNETYEFMAKIVEVWGSDPKQETEYVCNLYKTLSGHVKGASSEDADLTPEYVKAVAYFEGQEILRENPMAAALGFRPGSFVLSEEGVQKLTDCLNGDNLTQVRAGNTGYYSKRLQGEIKAIMVEVQ